MFSNLSLKQKILAGGLAPLIFLGVVNIISFINFNGVVNTLSQMERVHQVADTCNELKIIGLTMQTTSRVFFLTGQDDFMPPYTQASQKYREEFKKVKALTKDKESFEALDEAQKELEEWKIVIDGWIQHRKELAGNSRAAEMMSDLVKTKKATNHMINFLANMNKVNEREMYLLNEVTKNNRSITANTNNVIVYGTVIAMILSIMIAMFIVKIIVAPITIIKEAAIRISKGETDVSIDVEGRDELAEMAAAFTAMINSLNGISNIAHQIGKGNFNVTVTKRSENDVLGKALENMVVNLNTIMADLKEGTFALNSATAEILATTAQVSSGASQTSAAVAQTSASVEEIKQTAKVSSAKATQTAESASKTMEIAKSGAEELIENIKGLNQIKEKMDLIASNIIQLSSQSQQIGEITSTVEDIANQANMLAVNASIEAVKAGEQGKGFSVVAEELKNLAEQAKQGTKQVQKILFDIQKVTGTLVMVAEQGGKAVESGVKQAQNAKTSMDQLNSSVVNAANAGKQIAASYDQELAGMDQISGAMISVKEATSQNLSSIKQVEVSAKDLSALSQKLKEMMSHYTIANTK